MRRQNLDYPWPKYGAMWGTIWINLQPNGRFRDNEKRNRNLAKTDAEKPSSFAGVAFFVTDISSGAQDLAMRLACWADELEHLGCTGVLME